MNWISITEKLPKEFENILFSDGDCVHAGWMVYKYDEKYPTFYESWEHEMVDFITHWAEFPDPPSLKHD